MVAIYVINLLLHSFGSTGVIGFWTLVTFILARKGAKKDGHLKLNMMNKIALSSCRLIKIHLNAVSNFPWFSLSSPSVLPGKDPKSETLTPLERAVSPILLQHDIHQGVFVL